MTVKLLLIVSALTVARFSYAVSVPSFITKCSAADEDCITANAVRAIPTFVKGIPELDVEVLDPTYFDIVDSSKPNLKFLLKNITLTGMKDTKALSIRRDAPNSKIYMKLECAVECRSEYEMSGNVVSINLQGQGPMLVKIRFIVDIDADLVSVLGKDGKNHLNIKKFTYTYELLGNSEVFFGNLFPDNEVLRTATNEVIKTDGNAVVKDIGDPMFRAALIKYIKNINNLFSAIPTEDLSLDV